jgi:hypothetical protein
MMVMVIVRKDGNLKSKERDKKEEEKVMVVNGKKFLEPSFKYLSI